MHLLTENELKIYPLSSNIETANTGHAMPSALSIIDRECRGQMPLHVTDIKCFESCVNTNIGKLRFFYLLITDLFLFC